ncbi:MAG: hypothetical protein ACYDD4_11640, partial [Acidimicrobiales bacterium]
MRLGTPGIPDPDSAPSTDPKPGTFVGSAGSDGAEPVPPGADSKVEATAFKSGNPGSEGDPDSDGADPPTAPVTMEPAEPTVDVAVLGSGRDGRPGTDG